MINPNELRVGITLNIFPFEKVGFNPVIIDEQRLIALLKGEETTYHPIPLTPEILERCGFEKWEDSNVYQLDCADEENIQIRGEEVFLAGNEACIGGHGFHCKAKYLHQFQNLYFDLHGKELEIKELKKRLKPDYESRNKLPHFTRP